MTAQKINILGTEYAIYIKTQEEEPSLKNLSGFCDGFVKEIVLLDLEKDENWQK